MSGRSAKKQRRAIRDGLIDRGLTPDALEAHVRQEIEAR